jgi:hypothetical protein
MRRRLSQASAVAPWGVAIGGATAAWFLSTGRSAVVLNLVAVLAALYLGVRAYGISAFQAEQTARIIVLSRQPLLTAVHEPTGWPLESVKDAWFPAEQPFMISEGMPELSSGTAKAFSVLVEMTRKGERVDRALVYLRNVGEGPAMIATARLWSGLGLVGSLQGSASVGAGSIEAFNCELRHDPAFSETIPETASRWGAHQQEADFLRSEWRSRKPERLYFLEISYHDIFGTSENRPVLRSWFDPSGRGEWRTRNALSYPRLVQQEIKRAQG